MSINDTGITVTMKDGQAIDLGDFLQSAMNEIADEFDQLKRRLSTLEGNLKWLYEESGLDYPTPPEQEHTETDIQPPQSKAPDSTKQDEWIDLKKDDIEYWVTWSDGDVTHEVLSHLLSISSSFEPIPTHVMLCKYVPGDSKPLPPEVK